MVDLQTVFLFFFITLGPVKLILPFLNATAKADPELRTGIALRAFFISTIIVFVLVAAGNRITTMWNISKDAVSITGAVILFVWSIRLLMQQSTPSQPPSPPEHPTSELAAFPLAVPSIVTPAGVTVILFLTMSSFRDYRSLAILLGLLFATMVLNLICMLWAKWILKGIGGMATLQVIGGVLAVVQASLAVQVFIRSIHRLT